MRRIKLVVTLGVVIAAMVALSAAPAVADDGRHHNDRDNKKHDRDNKKHDHDRKFFDHDKGFVFVDDDVFLDLEDDIFDDENFVDVEVDFEKVPLRSALVGECFVTDIDGNGFIDDWEIEITCFVPRRWW